MSTDWEAQHQADDSSLVHKLPKAPLVDRVTLLEDICRGRTVIHVGFADAGFRQRQQSQGRWLHARLRAVAADLVGLDTDEQGVAEAKAEGYNVHQVDCTDPEAVAALGVPPAEVVLAGEIIEHLHSPGPFLDAMHHLCKSDGTLVITTPNAYGLINPAAAILRGVEINHPDHIAMFTWRTLTQLLIRHNWHPTETAVYVPSIPKQSPTPPGAPTKPPPKTAHLALRALLATEKLLAKAGRPFAADGLIIQSQRSRN